ncbi:exodeoxyribonuclease VII large subunit [Plantibacter sp. VKM Ac-2876]|uniref:exodeoxyribonuclease VII large subunit n=1 Tax=Plantibacter sp. VKM Ac-2876 TaxID=2783826 RepID=UPI00188ACC4B|nr:exodeoxyribonuclease VII large subunit [Plantibacter sp. VKM Ac-2876]MBF4563577.1 hypothetical protein [Plantibacter sp. VKM Ac-2876]
MSDAPRMSVAAELARVVDAARKPLGRRPVDVARGASLYADAVATVGTVALAGECRAPRESSDGRTVRFDLSDIDGRWTRMLVLAPDRQRIERFLQQDLLTVLSEGALIAVSGRFEVSGKSGERQLRVEKVSATSVPHAGAAYVARAEAERYLAAQRAARPERFEGRSAVNPYAESGPQIARRLTALGIQVKRVVVLRPADSQTNDEFSGGFRKAGLREDHMPVSFDAAPLSAALEAVSSDGETVVAIHRGGGHWSGRAALDDVRVVRAILDCAVPVLTGIGHSADLTVSDRAAFAAATTPTDLGKRIGAIAFAQSRPARRVEKSSAHPSALHSRNRDRHDDLARQRKHEAAELRAARASADWQFHRRIDEARSAAMYRLRVRGAILAMLWAVAGVILAGSSLAVLAGNSASAPVLAWMAAGCLLMMACSGSSGRRATWVTARQRKRGWPPIDDESWFVTAAQVRTPRQFRRHFAE